VASANVELVRSIVAAWERGDFSSAEWADPEIEFVFADGPTPGTWIGPAGMAEGFREFVSAWEEYSVKVYEYRDLDEERVLSLADWRGRGKTSGVDLGQMSAKGAGVWHIRDRKVTRYVLYFDFQRAFADLGLGPDAGSPSS
jgi:ketosteroid isomerase-like protein